MDKVRLKLTRNELVFLSDYVGDMVEAHNRVIRAKAADGDLWVEARSRFGIRLRCATLVLLSVRLQRLRIEVKPQYKVGLPVNECYGLLSMWTDRHDYPTEHRVMVQPTIARIDQALA